MQIRHVQFMQELEVALAFAKQVLGLAYQHQRGFFDQEEVPCEHCHPGL